MKKAMIFSAFIVATLMVMGFSGNQPSNKETRNVKDFTRVAFGIPGDLYVNFGSDYKVILEGDKDILDNIITQVSGGKLVIKEDNWHIRMDKKVTIYITMPALEGLSVSGSGKAVIKDAVKAKELDFSVSGSGKIYTADVTADALDCSISGSGDIILQGSGAISDAEIGISGSGNYTGESLKIGTADISISGSGSCLCNVTGSLKAGVSGSGNVTYIGNPKVDARVSGSGKVRSR
ncbi:MAG TPA: head GIN domain-containing protein [Bacteroidales bacterium]|nr:head GIN domain-containing protein [Bacteroidales bacterium]